jgi:hypothetical protein
MSERISRGLTPLIPVAILLLIVVQLAGGPAAFLTLVDNLVREFAMTVWQQVARGW